MFASLTSGIVAVFLCSASLVGQVRFSPPVNTSLDYLDGLLVTELNHDGIRDVIAFSSTTVYVLRGNGDGDFTGSISYGDGYIISSVATGNLNNDGLPDLAVLDSSLNTLEFYLATNDGFGSPRLHPVSEGARAVALGDFNKDNRLDVVTANSYSETVTVFFGDAMGGFLSAGRDYNVVGTPYWVTTADLDSDGNLDIITCNLDGQTLSVLYGNGNGNFEPPDYLQAGNSPRSVAVADFDGDQRSDLACANAESSNVSILLQSSTRNFGPATHYSEVNLPLTVSSGDMNGDGVTDLVSANFASGDVSILLGKGDGTFEGAGSFLTGGSPFAAVLADMDRDGQTDIITANNNPEFSLSVMLNRTRVSLQILPHPEGVKVRWPAYAIGATLESSSDLYPQPSWQTVTDSVNSEGDWNEIDFTSAEMKKFFQLKLD